jgi:hypothetical protein
LLVARDQRGDEGDEQERVGEADDAEERNPHRGAMAEPL